MHCHLPQNVPFCLQLCIQNKPEKISSPLEKQPSEPSSSCVGPGRCFQIASPCSGSVHFQQQQTDAASEKKVPVRHEVQCSTFLNEGRGAESVGGRVFLIHSQKAACGPVNEGFGNEEKEFKLSLC